MRKKLTASMEDYLEAILLEVEENHVARVKDISDRLDVGKSATSEAIRHLKERGLVAHESYGWIRLTPGGEAFARDVVRRHATMKRFLLDILGMSEGEAERNACVMEHVMPSAVENRLRKFMEFFERSDCRAAWDAETGARNDPGAKRTRMSVAGRKKGRSG